MKAVNAPSKGLLGNVVTCAVLIATVAMTYGKLEGRVSAVEERMTSLENDMMPILRETRKDISEIKVQLATVQADVEWLKNVKETTD